MSNIVLFPTNYRGDVPTQVDGGFVAGYGSAIADMSRSSLPVAAWRLIEKSGFTLDDFVMSGLDDSDALEIVKLYRTFGSY